MFCTDLSCGHAVVLEGRPAAVRQAAEPENHTGHHNQGIGPDAQPALQVQQEGTRRLSSESSRKRMLKVTTSPQDRMTTLCHRALMCSHCLTPVHQLMTAAFCPSHTLARRREQTCKIKQKSHVLVFNRPVFYLVLSALLRWTVNGIHASCNPAMKAPPTLVSPPACKPGLQP